MANPTHEANYGGDRLVNRYERDLELFDSASSHMAVAEASSGRMVVGEFAAESDSPGRARRLALDALAEWGCGPVLLQDAAVVVSELATNAVLHADSSFSISATLEDSLLRISVHDTEPLSVTVGGGGLSPQPTHGLSLVEALSLRWGAEGTARGKVVWAELHVPNEL
jgi:hypothetical protein